jgi:hypothetical protein
MMKRNSQHLSSSEQGDESLLDETACFGTNLDNVDLEDIETLNRLSSGITLQQLDQTLALIRSG